MKNDMYLDHTVSPNFGKIFLASSPTYEGAEFGDIYGQLFGDRFCIYQKIPPRSIRDLCQYYLQGEIMKNGHIKYRYRRTVSSLATTLITPFVMLILGCFLGGFILGIEAMYIFSLPAVCLLLCNFITRKKLKRSLLGFLLYVVGLDKKK